MNHMLTDTDDAPWNDDPRNRRPIECDSCHKPMEECETEDPCTIDGRDFCDECASDYIAFRCGTFRDVGLMTKELLADFTPLPIEIK